MRRFTIYLFPATLVFTVVAIPRGGRAADSPSTSDVLGKLHGANQTEIEMGKAAAKEGRSKATKALGKMLVKDHSAADRHTEALAEEQKISLPTPEPAIAMTPPLAGPEFDVQFAQMMVGAHREDIKWLTNVRDRTTDEKLKKLLTDLLPTLQRHEDAATKILDSAEKKGG